jgi:hypothetical protein
MADLCTPALYSDINNAKNVPSACFGHTLAARSRNARVAIRPIQPKLRSMRLAEARPDIKRK